MIVEFLSHLRNHPDEQLCIDKLINANCKSRTFADVEFVSKSGLHWVIEAKSNDSPDMYNTVHKIFGEVLKETGRTNRSDCRHAILLPADSLNFYSRAFQCIAREKFAGFGSLIPIDTVFTSDSSGIARIAWMDLYDIYKR